MDAVPPPVPGASTAVATGGPHILPGTLDATGQVVADIACKRCSYNLRGLHANGQCPECGTAVGLSIYGNYLRFADPDWVEKLARGALFILWGMLASIVGACAGGAINAAARAPLLGHAIIMISSLVGLIGVWFLTTPDPGHVGEDRFVRARQIVRVSLIAGLVSTFSQSLVEGGGMSSTLRLVAQALVVLVAIFQVVSQWFYMLYIEHLLTRVPNQQQADRTRKLRIATLVSYAVLVVSGAGAGLGIALKSDAITVLFGIPAAISLLAVAVCGLLLIGILLRFRKDLREQALAARATWAAVARAA